MSELQKFGENIWIVEGPLVKDIGIMFTTRMTIVKLSNGSLWIDSPVPVPNSTIQAIRDLGHVKYLVAATPRHVWRLKDWHSLFPDAELWITKITRFTLKEGNLPFTGILKDEIPPEWAQDLDLVVFKGNPYIEEGLFLHKKSRTVIMDDLIQIHHHRKGKIFYNMLVKLMGMGAPDGGVSLDLRLSFIHRRLARESLEKLLSWNFDKLIIAHGPCIEKDAKSFVKHAFRWLRRKSKK
jgi:hypothetical protein